MTPEELIEHGWRRCRVAIVDREGNEVGPIGYYECRRLILNGRRCIKTRAMIHVPVLSVGAGDPKLQMRDGHDRLIAEFSPKGVCIPGIGVFVLEQGYHFVEEKDRDGT